ncbi:RcnB family protein [Brevundimonas aurantiaca]|uniref:Ni/Co efflux regulator RcnB n=1 Tax=Brevundimonas aurantiaca TaxID=74316 RepID=A0A7W9F6Y1_9CAUL|nr:RcnB family protein [Brevundimonas aurantiaca]MBB5738310.1 Ni/Co efflux regulator RcnB [Brevundimonas aurantiaca]
MIASFCPSFRGADSSYSWRSFRGSRHYRWRTGAYLPPQYRTYYVRDPYFYGLRPAPHGYRYVHAGSDILLVAVATGLIASVLSNVY